MSAFKVLYLYARKNAVSRGEIHNFEKVVSLKRNLC